MSMRLSGSLAMSGSIIATGQIVAQTLNVQQVTSSIVYSSGSNIFGNSLANTQIMTGSVLVTGSLTVSGPISGTGPTQGTIVYGSTVACSPIGCFATSCATSFVGGTMSGTTLYGSTTVCSPSILSSGTICSTGNTCFGGNTIIAGCVGIGNNNPSVALDVSGEIAIRGGETENDARLLFRASDNSNRFTIQTDLDGNTACDLLTFRGIAAENIFTLKGNGFVGIGNCSPSARLHVSSTSANILVEGTATNGEGSISIRGRNSSGDTREAIFKYDNVDAIRVATANCITMRFETSDVTRMCITSTGIAVFSCQVCAPAFVGGTVSGTTGTFSGKLSVSQASTDFVAEFTNTANSTPYGLRIKDAGTPANNYPLLSVTNNVGSTEYFRVNSGTGITTFSSTVCSPSLDIMPSGIGVNTLGGIMRVVTTGTSAGIAVGQSNANRYTHFAANDIQVFNDDFFLSTRCAFPLSIGTCYTARLTFAATGVACFSCQVCAPRAIFTNCVGILQTAIESPLDIGNESNQAAWSSCTSCDANLGENFENNIIIQAQHAPGANCAYGYPASNLVFRASNTGNAIWNLGAIQAVVDPFGGSNYQGGLVFLTKPTSNSCDPVGRKTQGGPLVPILALGQNASNTRIAYFNSNVGIGTASPLTTLDVRGDAFLIKNTTAFADTGGPVLSIGETTTEVGMAGGISFTEGLGSFVSSVSMGIYYDGKQNRMHIVGSCNSNTLVGCSMICAPKHITILRDSTAVGIGNTGPTTYGEGYANLWVGDTGKIGYISAYNGTVTMEINADGVGNVRTRSNHNLVLGTNETARVTITNTGIACFACAVCAPIFSAISQMRLGSNVYQFVGQKSFTENTTDVPFFRITDNGVGQGAFMIFVQLNSTNGPTCSFAGQVYQGFLNKFWGGWHGQGLNISSNGAGGGSSTISSVVICNTGCIVFRVNTSNNGTGTSNSTTAYVTVVSDGYVPSFSIV